MQPWHTVLQKETEEQNHLFYLWYLWFLLTSSSTHTHTHPGPHSLLSDATTQPSCYVQLGNPWTMRTDSPDFGEVKSSYEKGYNAYSLSWGESDIFCRVNWKSRYKRAGQGWLGQSRTKTINKRRLCICLHRLGGWGFTMAEISNCEEQLRISLRDQTVNQENCRNQYNKQ